MDILLAEFHQACIYTVPKYVSYSKTEVVGVRNPHGLEESWAWLARLLHALPANTYTAVALEAFLKMAGFGLSKKYKSQFKNMLDVISNHCLNALKAQDPELNVVIEKLNVVITMIRSYIGDKFLQEPEGLRLKGSLLSSSMIHSPVATALPSPSAPPLLLVHMPSAPLVVSLLLLVHAPAPAPAPAPARSPPRHHLRNSSSTRHWVLSLRSEREKGGVKKGKWGCAKCAAFGRFPANARWTVDGSKDRRRQKYVPTKVAQSAPRFSVFHPIKTQFMIQNMRNGNERGESVSQTLERTNRKPPETNLSSNESIFLLLNFSISKVVGIMDSKKQSPSPDNADAKTAFRKPSNDTANRKYRRHSPVSGSSSSDGSPKREHGSSPIFSREDPRRVSDIRHRRKDDGRELDRDSGRNQYGRSDMMTIDTTSTQDEEERNYHRLSSRSGRELRDGTRSDPMRQESEPTRSRDYVRHVDKYSREKYDSAGHRSKDKERETLSLEDQKYKDRDLSSDRGGSGRRHTNSNFEEIKSSEWDRHMRDGDGRDEKRDHRRSMGDCKSDRALYEESRGHRSDSTLRRDNGGHRLKEAYKSDPKELDGQKHTKEERKTYEDTESNRHMDRYVRKPGEHSEDKTIIVNENEESLAKKPKLFSLDKGIDHGKDVLKLSTAVADERQSSSSKQAHGIVGKVTPDKVCANDSEPANDLNAAKVAAMKAAELVNKNLIGVGYMSTDQKKKLLWGSKKSTAAEEQSGHHWDTGTVF
ncbi:hypothetical protein L1049_008939 [Liquidambar formosana]|uniref:Uncharacterized protein n=1 Tax=Liquidambar formosana TaxID=63359 RepID=A0AAP0S498_LIQFO